MEGGVVMYYANNYLPHQQVIRVNGEAGAKNIRLAPQSSLLALDENAPLIWLITTDGGGYSTCKCFEIVEKQEEPSDMDKIMKRIDELEAKINESYITSNDAKGQSANAKCSSKSNDVKATIGKQS